MDRLSTPSPRPDFSSRELGELLRLSELRDLCILDTPPEDAYDRVTRLAARSLGVPIAVISLVDEQRAWLKARVGLEATEVPRNVSFCTRVVDQRRALVIADTLADPLYAAHPLVAGPPHARAYLGVPIHTRSGAAIGTLCAMDTRPREFTSGELDTWNEFALLVQELIHAREMSLESQRRLDAASASEQKHAQMERRLQRIADHIPALIGYWNTELRCEFANEAYRAYSGLSPQQMLGRHFREVLGDRFFTLNSPHAYAALAGEPQRFQRRNVGLDGIARDTEAQYLPDRDENGAVRGFFVLVTDITELTAAKGALELSNAKLLKESTTDFLTGLANRRVFTERCEALHKRLRQSGEGYALILLDLDDFKQINDRLGHEVGDQVLRTVGKVLGELLRGRDDLAARLGGEEFALLCPGAFTAESLLEVARRVRDCINTTAVESPRGPVHFTASIGIACCSPADSGWTGIFARADSALYEAKETGKDRIVFGDSSAKGSTGRFRSLGIPPIP